MNTKSNTINKWFQYSPLHTQDPNCGVFFKLTERSCQNGEEVYMWNSIMCMFVKECILTHLNISLMSCDIISGHFSEVKVLIVTESNSYESTGSSYIYIRVHIIQIFFQQNSMLFLLFSFIAGKTNQTLQICIEKDNPYS